jgi:hypothetical protein
MHWNSHIRYMRVAALLVMILTLVQLSFSQGAQKFEEVSCRSVAHVAVPKYRIGNNLGGTTNADTFILFVSVKPADLSREKMVALACRLAQVYEAFDEFFLMVFEEHALLCCAIHQGSMSRTRRLIPKPVRLTTWTSLATRGGLSGSPRAVIGCGQRTSN